MISAVNLLPPSNGNKQYWLNNSMEMIVNNQTDPKKKAMTNRIFIKSTLIAILILSVTGKRSFAQDNVTLKTYKVGIFAPLYLDSVYKDGNYQYAKKFPRFVVNGLDFIQGALIALDSMPLYNANIDARFYDSKSKDEPVAFLIDQNRLDSLDLIIGSVKDEEYGQLANFALTKNIPFISATYPNDGGIAGNPYLIIINSTLKAHCEAIYAYMMQNHGTDNIIMARRSGLQEDKVAGYFSQVNEVDQKPFLRIKQFLTDSNFIALKNILDSTKENIIIGASLDEEFASGLASMAASLQKKYRIKLIGMPNWETFNAFTNPKKTSNGEFPVYFTSPYYNYKIDHYSRMIQDVYLKKFKGKPSDFAYKGFETVFVFSKLLSMYPENFMGHLNDYAYKVFSEYHFRPVFLNKNAARPDYFENKNLYFLKIQNSTVTRAW